MFASCITFTEPLPQNMSEKEKILFLQKRCDILTKFKDYISNYLDPSKVIYFDLSRDDLRQVESRSYILVELNIDKERL